MEVDGGRHEWIKSAKWSFRKLSRKKRKTEQISCNSKGKHVRVCVTKQCCAHTEMPFLTWRFTWEVQWFLSVPLVSLQRILAHYYWQNVNNGGCKHFWSVNSLSIVRSNIRIITVRQRGMWAGTTDWNTAVESASERDFHVGTDNVSAVSHNNTTAWRSSLCWSLPLSQTALQ